MKNTEEIVVDIANGIRKIEDLLDAQRKLQRLATHEVKCLHKCLEEVMKDSNYSIDDKKAGLYGGGTPKD